MLLKSCPPEGFLFIATGDSYRQEALESAKKLREYSGGRPIALCTDCITVESLDLFDFVFLHPSPAFSYSDKISPLIRPPFKRTIFLDTDVRLCDSVEEIFTLLRTFHFVGCHAPVRWAQWRDRSVPVAFTEINSGVIGLRRGFRQWLLVNRWLKMYSFASVSFDQASLLSALWWSCRHWHLRLYIMPPEYNLRTPKPWLVGPGLPVKIVHGRLSDSTHSKLLMYLNEDSNSFRASSEFATGQNQSPLKGPDSPVS